MNMVVPSNLNIYYEARVSQNYPENIAPLHIAEFIRQLDYFCLKLKLPHIELDFRKIAHFTSAAATVLFAHINHLQRTTNTTFKFLFDKKSPLNAQLSIFRQAINANTEEKLLALETKFSPWQSGCVPNSKIEQIINYFNALRNSLKLNQNESDTLSLLQTAIYEALMNVQDHAYLGEKSHWEKRWWQMLWCSNRDKHPFINFIIYDLGVGIVESYKHHNQRELSPFLRSADDILRDAVKLGHSRSGELERGNGLYEMFRPLEEKRVALWMYSNNVLLRRIPSKNIDDCYSVPLTLPGTLIEWTFSLE